jgi:hypothetical protein
MALISQVKFGVSRMIVVRRIIASDFYMEVISMAKRQPSYKKPKELEKFQLYVLLAIGLTLLISQLGFGNWNILSFAVAVSFILFSILRLKGAGIFEGYAGRWRLA